MEKKLAPEFSMDIPHVMAVELPLKVKNTDRAISMIGGKEIINKVINADINESGVETLELKLRNDRFCHPIKSSCTNKEKVLLKVSIPKRNLPAGHDKMSIQEILKHNEQCGSGYTIAPVGIINKTHSFKAMTDFQVNTKNNKLVQEVNNGLVNAKDYSQLKSFVDSKTFINNPDYKHKEQYGNKDHNLPPPPLFSPIRFPFDYQYEKNSISVTVKDPTSGELKVVSKKQTLKLYTQIIDVNKDEVPKKPAQPLIDHLDSMEKSRSLKYYDEELLSCIEWLRTIFGIKPIWLRKHLEDIIPQEHRRSLKQALPYVSYIFKNGPWRFCSIKYGVDPKTDRSNWIYQSEYFRILDNSVKKRMGQQSGELRMTPLTVDTKNIKMSENLIFQGTKLPSTITFQVGDIIDLDIRTFIDMQGPSMLRETLDFQDGWISKQVIETVRRIIRYKLRQLVTDGPIEEEKIQKIKDTSYDEKGGSEEEDEDDDMDLELDELEELDEQDDLAEPEEEDDDDEAETETQVKSEFEDALTTAAGDAEDESMTEDNDADELDYATASEKEQDTPQDPATASDLLQKIDKYDSLAAQKLAGITSVTRQESFM